MSALAFDEARLTQVLNNLVANAARHTHNGTIRIDCSVSTMTDIAPGITPIRLDFSVIDSGEGVDIADIERIFLPFERGSNAGRKGDKGTGMGLTIARQLVSAMGGNLTATSRPGEGSQFRFWIQAQATPVKAARSTNDGRQQSSYGAYLGQRRTVLVVDDHQQSRQVLCKLLQGCGFVVHEATSGHEAVQFLQGATQPDLVLTDQLMQDGDGWVVVQACVTHSSPIPVVMISALPPQRPSGLGESVRCAIHLLKPLDHAQFLQQIGDLLQLEWDKSIQQEPSKRPPPLPPPASPPAADLQALKSMVDAGQVSEVMRWAEDLKASNPNCARFADEVYVAARFLDFPALHALLSDRKRQS